MKKTPYKPKPGDMEIRILNNGKVMMVLPDQKLIEIAQSLEPNNTALPQTTEKEQNVRNQAK
jgi:hypothetical protein